MERPSLRVTTVNLAARDPKALADFYVRLLGGEVGHAEDDFLIIRLPDGQVSLSFQSETFARPVWPAGPTDPHMMMHLEVYVDDLASAAAYAIECGAQEADYQPQQGVRVMIDPEGHPFCLFVD